MKKKISLRLELVLIMLLSLVIAFTAAFLIRNTGVGFHRNSKEERIEQRYKECIDKLEESFAACDLRDTKAVNMLMQQNYNYMVGYTFALVDENGCVISSSTPGIGTIDEKWIKNGIREYQVSEEDTNIFKITGCDNIKKGYYLYYSYLYFDENDTGMVAGALLGAVCCFFFLIWGRISYISQIRKSVGKMAQGDLGERISCRYRNELRELAEDINQMAESLENEEQRKNEFMTNISHDIRTPLTTMLGYLNMVKNRNYDSEDVLQQYISIMERKGKFLAAMLEDFFQYSKLASHDIEMKCMELNLNELLRQISEDEEAEFQEKELELELQLEQEPAFCEGDAELLARVVNNLLSNAQKYSRKGTKVYIKSGHERNGHTNYAVFSVSSIPDQSMTEEEITKLFERLYKKDPARKEEGSGLGLSIARQIMKLHGGRMEGKMEGERLIFKAYIRILCSDANSL